MKRILALLLAFAMVFALVGCGSSNSSDGDSTEKKVDTSEPGEPVEEETEEKVSYNSSNLDNILSAFSTQVDASIETITEQAETALAQLEDSDDPYKTYLDNQSAATDFYSGSLAEANALYDSIKDISLDYYKCVAANGLSDYDTWDDAMEDCYDKWDDAMEDFYDEWDDLYEDIYKQCDDLISDGYDGDSYDYSEVSDSWSEMYSAYSDAWSAMYEAYSDAWSNLYSDYSNIWSGFYEGYTDIDTILEAAAKKEAAESATASEEEPSDAEVPAEAAEPEEGKEAEEPTGTVEEETDEELVDGMRPEFKEAMDSYEDFFEKYCDFMESYDSSDLTMLTEYAEMMAQYSETMEKLDDIDEDELNDAEQDYYTEVMLRINNMLAETAVSME